MPGLQSISGMEFPDLRCSEGRLMGWSGRASAPLARKLWGFEPRKEHVSCHGLLPLPPLPPWASIWARTASISSARMSAAPSCCASSSPGTQLTQRLANIPPCLIGMEACAGSHHIGRQLQALGHDVRLIPAQYVKPFPQGAQERLPRCRSHCGGGAAAHHVVRGDQDARPNGSARPAPGALAPGRPAHRRDQPDPRLLLERGITVRQGLAPLRQALPGILGSSSDALSPRMVRLIADLAEDWRRLDERIAAVSAEIEALAPRTNTVSA